MSKIFSSPISSILENIDGVKELSEKILDGAVGDKRFSAMNIFKYKGVSYSSLYIKSDEVCGVNLRVGYAYTMTQKKTRTQILNDINSFNYNRIGVKVVLKSLKGNSIHLNFDCEFWLYPDILSPKMILANIENLLVSPSFFSDDFNYLGK